MNLAAAKTLLTGLKNRGLEGTLSYSLGRFHTVRQAYGRGVGLIQKQRQTPGIASDAPSLFAPLDVDDAVASLERTAVFGGLQLPPTTIAELLAHAREAPLRPPTKNYNFFYKDVVDGRVPNGEPAILAIVVGADRHPTVRRVAEDAQAYEIVRRYLGYNPRHLDIRLQWSFVTSSSDAERLRASQTVDYHFDVHHYNFVYANYYITDCDAKSGAHAMVLGSHREKPLSWMLGSVRQSDHAITQHYGRANELTIEGKSGYGFIQDASCYHKALAPIERERLMVHIRYF
jgi:hypothetical protein